MLVLLSACASDEASRPNFVIVDIDSMRADRVTIERDGAPLAPTLARLAREGVVYTQAYAQSGWTLPSVQALMTGHWPLVQELASAEGSTEFGMTERSLFDLLPLYGYEVRSSFGGTLPSTSRTLREALHAEETDAVAYVRNTREPFFLYLHTLDLHFPQPAPPDAALHRWDTTPHAPFTQLHELYRAVPSIPHVTSHYDGALAVYDTFLAALLDALEETGRAARTVVILTSDHGEELGEHGVVGHAGVHYDTVLHVPLVVRDPAEPGGRTVDREVQTIDLAPSVLARAGIPLDATMEGRPWSVEGPARPLYSLSSLAVASVRTDRWKLAVHAGTCPATPTSGSVPVCPELFDLVDDPGETRNVVEQYPAEREQLMAGLVEWVRARALETKGGREDAELKEALKRGGYWGLVEQGPPRLPPDGAVAPAEGAVGPADGAVGPPI